MLVVDVTGGEGGHGFRQPAQLAGGEDAVAGGAGVQPAVVTQPGGGAEAAAGGVALTALEEGEAAGELGVQAAALLPELDQLLAVDEGGLFGGEGVDGLADLGQG